MKRKCKECGEAFTGRSDKIYCSDHCRTSHYNKMHGDSTRAIRMVNRILRKNRRILKELNTKGKTTVLRNVMVAKGFNFTYHTSTYTTRKGNVYVFCYDQGFMARFFFGWEGGFEVRGIVHRAAAVLFMGTIVWHVIFLFTGRGRKFIKDMLPVPRDFQFFLRRMLYNLGLRRRWECIQRFSYVEKAEYWALVWGTVVMVITGIMLWFDNWFIQFLPKGVLDHQTALAGSVSEFPDGRN